MVKENYSPLLLLQEETSLFNPQHDTHRENSFKDLSQLDRLTFMIPAACKSITMGNT